MTCVSMSRLFNFVVVVVVVLILPYSQSLEFFLSRVAEGSHSCAIPVYLLFSSIGLESWGDTDYKIL